MREVETRQKLQQDVEIAKGVADHLFENIEVREVARLVRDALDGEVITKALNGDPYALDDARKLVDREIIRLVDDGLYDGSGQSSSPKVEGAKFHIARVGSNNWESYQEVTSEVDAIAAYRAAIQRVSNPSEIEIIEETPDGDSFSTRSDLMDRANPKLDMPLKDVTLETKIDMHTARELGATLYKGTNWYDYEGQPMSLDEMAKLEACSIRDAQNRQLQTTISPSNGMHVSWTDWESPLAKLYSERVQEHLAALSKV